jgi:hypothetical protein
MAVKAELVSANSKRSVLCPPVGIMSNTRSGYRVVTPGPAFPLNQIRAGCGAEPRPVAAREGREDARESGVSPALTASRKKEK